jgi:endogenous inhibitor of DNA gyrase (YacG/DUF329 family)
MGDMADMMLDGTMCGTCGVYIGGAAGYQQYCSKECEPPGYESESSAPAKPKVNCPRCHKRVKSAGLDAHIRDVHGKRPSPDGGGRK